MLFWYINTRCPLVQAPSALKCCGIGKYFLAVCEHGYFNCTTLFAYEKAGCSLAYKAVASPDSAVCKLSKFTAHHFRKVCVYTFCLGNTASKAIPEKEFSKWSYVSVISFLFKVTVFKCTI